MKRYTTYKDSGVKWIGAIPSHWNCVLNGVIYREEIRNPLKTDIPLSMSQADGLIPSEQLTIQTLKTASYNNWKRVIKGDIVLNRFKAHLGVLFASNYIGMVSFHYGVYEPKLPIIPKYFEYLYHTPVYRYIYAASSKGMTVGLQNLSNRDFYAVKSIYPPLSEQRAIVSFLDTELGKIDTYMEKEQQLIDRLKELKQSVIARAVTRGINPDAKMKPSGINWIGEIPEHWEVKRLSQVAIEYFVSNKNVHHQNLLSLSYGNIVRKDINTTEGLLPASFDNYQVVDDGIIVLRLTDLQNDHKSLRVGLAHEEGIVTSAYLSIKPRDNITSEYLYEQLHCNDTHKVFYGMGDGLRQSLNWQGLRNLLIALPPLDEQQAIVDYITAATTKIDKLIVEKTYELEYMKELRQRVISDVVTGKIDVRE